MWVRTWRIPFHQIYWKLFWHSLYKISQCVIPPKNYMVRSGVRSKQGKINLKLCKMAKILSISMQKYTLHEHFITRCHSSWGTSKLKETRSKDRCLQPWCPSSYESVSIKRVYVLSFIPLVVGDISLEEWEIGIVPYTPYFTLVPPMDDMQHYPVGQWTSEKHLADTLLCTAKVARQVKSGIDWVEFNVPWAR